MLTVHGEIGSEMPPWQVSPWEARSSCGAFLMSSNAVWKFAGEDDQLARRRCQLENVPVGTVPFLPRVFAAFLPFLPASWNCPVFARQLELSRFCPFLPSRFCRPVFAVPFLPFLCF
jgi:hypothetical protein